MFVLHEQNFLILTKSAKIRARDLVHRPSLGLGELTRRPR